MLVRRGLAGVAGIVAGFCLVGCAAQDVTTTTTTSSAVASRTTTTSVKPKPPTKEQYIATADAICAEGNKAMGQNMADPSAPPDFEAIIEQMTGVMRKQLDQLEKLPAPAGDEKKVAKIWESAEKGLAKLETQSADELMNSEDPLAESGELARAYGLQQCGAQG